MIWLSWRQLRTSVVGVAILLVALLVVLWVSGTQLLHAFDTDVLPCHAHHDCGPVGANFQALGHLTHVLSTLVIVAPILAGVFWGAPLVARELETGSYRLTWTQSVTRRRWSLVRLAMVAAVAIVVVAILTAAITWWQQPIDRFNDTPYTYFDSRDLVPVAYTAFALTLGALLGALLKRTILAMLATVAGFAVVRYLISSYVWPHLVAPLKAVSPFKVTVTPGGIGAQIGPPNGSDLVISNLITTGSGRVVGANGGLGPTGGIGFNVHANGTATLVGVGPCPNRIPTGNQASSPAMQRCVDSFHLREVVTYQPPSHFWPLQWTTSAVFVALAIALGAACVWVVRRRLP
jgi:hypothetical protein